MATSMPQLRNIIPAKGSVKKCVSKVQYCILKVAAFK